MSDTDSTESGTEHELLQQHREAFDDAETAEDVADAFEDCGVTARGYNDCPGADTVVVERESTRLHDEEMLEVADRAGFGLFARDADELTLYDESQAEW